jgi:hypothetical protein
MNCGIVLLKNKKEIIVELAFVEDPYQQNHLI